ncbi:hypothetical protein [Mesorhizobium sp. CN2-181]|uniref:hypothetical protein n=1 Tax=Mesorhizobium yinganensis TaxID=3157707 RepID=UPI0032B7EA77
MSYHARLTLDAPPAGWHALDVMPQGDGSCKGEWVAFMIDVPYEDLKHCHCRTAFLYVHPKEYRPDGKRIAQEAYVRVPGRHRSHKAAWRAFQVILEGGQ